MRLQRQKVLVEKSASPAQYRCVSQRGCCAGGLLPLELCQGYTLELAPPAEPPATAASAPIGCKPPPEVTARSTQGSASSPAARAPAADDAAPGHPREPAGGSLYPAGAPSLLGEFYVAAQGRAAAVVGATRRYGLTPEASLADCGREVNPKDGNAAAGARALKAEAAALWPAAATWQVCLGFLV